MEKKDNEWTTIDPQPYKFKKEGDSCEGLYLGKAEKTADLSIQYHFEHKKNQFFVWGSVVLDDRMQHVRIGDYVRITYVEEETTKSGRPVKIYKVEVKSKIESPSEMMANALSEFGAATQI